MAAEAADSALSDGEFSLVQRYVDHVVERFLELRLTLELEHDFDLFTGIRRANVDGWVYPSFDPQLSDLGAEALWVRAVDRSGQTVATIAARVFRTADFYELMRDGTLWFSGQSISRERCSVEADLRPQVGGVVGHTGGLWIHPSWRGHRIAPAMPRFSRALLLRNWSVHHDTALVFERIARTSLPTRGYGYATVTRVVDGFFPPTERSDRVYLCHIDRGKALAAMARELAEGEALGRFKVAV